MPYKHAVVMGKPAASKSMPKSNAWIATKMSFGMALMLAMMTILGCNQPSVPTAVNETLLNSDLTSLLEEKLGQQLDLANPHSAA